MPYDQMIERYHDFFVLAGTAAATLAGLLFVAVSLHPELIVARRADADLRALAWSTFTDFLNALLVSLVVLIPQSRKSLGYVLLVIAVFELVTSSFELRSVIKGSARNMARTRLLRRLGSPLVMLVLLGVSSVGLIAGGEHWLTAVVVVPIVLLIQGAFGSWDLLSQIGERRRVEADPGAPEGSDPLDAG